MARNLKIGRASGEVNTGYGCLLALHPHSDSLFMNSLRDFDSDQ